MVAAQGRMRLNRFLIAILLSVFANTACLAVPAPPPPSDDEPVDDDNDKKSNDDDDDDEPDAGPRPDLPGASEPFELTHSSSPTVAAGTSITDCHDESGHLDEDASYFRVFDLATLPNGKDTYEIRKVEYGVEIANGSAGSQLVTVKLHTLTGTLPTGNFSVAGLTPLKSEATVLANVGGVSTQSVDIAATVTRGQLLVAEISVPDGHIGGAQNAFLIGMNGAAQTGPTFVRDCGENNTATDATQLGSSRSLVLKVVGDVKR